MGIETFLQGLRELKTEHKGLDLVSGTHDSCLNIIYFSYFSPFTLCLFPFFSSLCLLLSPFLLPFLFPFYSLSFCSPLQTLIKENWYLLLPKYSFRFLISTHVLISSTLLAWLPPLPTDLKLQGPSYFPYSFLCEIFPAHLNLKSSLPPVNSHSSGLFAIWWQEKSLWPRSQETWIIFLALPLNSYVTSGKSFTLHKFYTSHL